MEYGGIGGSCAEDLALDGRPTISANETFRPRGDNKSDWLTSAMFSSYSLNDANGIIILLATKALYL